MAGSRISATDTDLLPKCWMVSIQAAAAPVKMCEEKLPKIQAYADQGL